MCKTVQSESSTSSSTNTYTSKDNSNKSRSGLETKLKILNQTKTSDELLSERQANKPKGAWAKLFSALFTDSSTTEYKVKRSGKKLEEGVTTDPQHGVFNPKGYKDCGGGGQDFGYPDIPLTYKTHIDTVDDYMFGDFLKFSTNPSYHYSCDVIAKVRKEHTQRYITILRTYECL